MPVLLDCRAIDPADRQEHLVEAFRLAGFPSDVVVSELTGTGNTSIEQAGFGPAQIVQIHTTAMVIRRTEQHVKQFDDLPCVDIAVPSAVAEFAQADHFQAVQRGQAFVVDRSTPCEIHWPSGGDSISFVVPYYEFGLPFELIRKAASRLATSTLCGVVADHLLRLAQDTDSLSEDSSATQIGVATVQMIRALITSAAGEDRRARDAAGESLLLFILAYTRQHLTETDLTPTRIARAHHISLRHLYSLCQAADIRITDWILEQRLVGAALDLENPRLEFRTIQSTARRWGFTDQTHFGRRFKATYGVSPREFKNLDASARTGIPRPDRIPARKDLAAEFGMN